MPGHTFWLLCVVLHRAGLASGHQSESGEHKLIVDGHSVHHDHHDDDHDDHHHNQFDHHDHREQHDNHEQHGHEHQGDDNHHHNHHGHVCHGHDHVHGESFWDEVQEAFVDSVPWLVLGLIISGALEAVMPSRAALVRFLGGGGIADVAKGAVAGLCVPLCSCGALPVAVTLGESGASPRAVVAFVTAAQSAGLDSALVTYGTLGSQVAVSRLCAALVIACAAGFAAPGSSSVASVNKHPEMKTEKKDVLTRALCGVRCALTDTFDEVAPWVLVGLVFTAAATTFAPKESESDWLSSGHLGRLAVLAGTMPLQLCEHSTVLFAGALKRAGVSSGTAFAFLISAPATNLATMAMLVRRQPARSFGVIRIAAAMTCGALAVSFAFDMSGIGFEVLGGGHDLPAWFVNASLYITILLVIGFFWRLASGERHVHSD